MRKILFVITGLIFLSAPAGAGAAGLRPEAVSGPCSVQKIFVADFGKDPRHVSFRLDLEKWLSKKKFTVARRPEDADAVLSGTFSTRSGDKYSYLTFKDAELKTAGGETAWRGDFDFKTRNAFGWLGRGHIENGAKRIAENIRASCK